MISVFIGEQTEMSKQKREKVLAPFRQSNALTIFTDTDFDQVSFEEIIFSPNLFGEKSAVLLLHVFEKRELVDYLLKTLAKKDIFSDIVVVENFLLAPIISKLKKVTENIFSDLKRKTLKKSETFNVFSLTDALGERDKKRLWLLFSEAIKNGTDPLEIIPSFEWIIKIIKLVKTGIENSELKINPFVFNKAKKFSKNFSDTEVSDFFNKLVNISNQTKKGGDGELLLERFILSI